MIALALFGEICVCVAISSTNVRTRIEPNIGKNIEFFPNPRRLIGLKKARASFILIIYSYLYMLGDICKNIAINMYDYSNGTLADL